MWSFHSMRLHCVSIRSRIDACTEPPRSDVVLPRRRPSPLWGMSSTCEVGLRGGSARWACRSLTGEGGSAAPPWKLTPRGFPDWDLHTDGNGCKLLSCLLKGLWVPEGIFPSCSCLLLRPPPFLCIHRSRGKGAVNLAPTPVIGEDLSRPGETLGSEI